MIGAYLVFAVVLAIVVTYMAIVHKFLVDGESPEDIDREATYRRESVTRFSRKSAPSRSAFDAKTA